MKKSKIISQIAFAWGLGLMGVAPVWAQTCIKTPSCADLGYTKTTTACAGKTILKCPLDTTKVYCPSYEETLRTYKVGDTYIDSNGMGGGKIVSVDSSGRHGIMVVTAGTGKLETVQNYCTTLTTGTGYIWQLASFGTYTSMNRGKAYFDNCAVYHASGGRCHMCGNDIGSCSGSIESGSAGAYCQAAF